MSREAATRRAENLRTRLRAGAARLGGPVATLAGGAVAAQAVAYAARPLLTRLFTPAEFGLLAFYTAAVGVPAALATGRYEDAAMLPARDDDAARLTRLALGLAAGVAAVLVALAPLRGVVAGWVGQPEAAGVLAVVGPGMLAVAAARACEVWLTRRHRYGTVSAGRVAQNAVGVPAQVAAGVLGWGAFGLVGGLLAGRLVSAAGLLVASWRDARAVGAADAGATSTRALAVRYRRFPVLAMPSGVLNTASMQLPAFLLLGLASADAVGFFGVAYGTLAVPMQLVGGSVAQVFFVRAAEAYRTGGLGPLTRDATTRLAWLGAFPMGALAVVGPAAFSIVFGDAWREAGVYAQMLSAWLFVVFVGSPVTTLFDVLERQGTELAINAALVAARAGALVAGAHAGGAVGAVAAFGAVSAVAWSGQTLWLLSLSGVDVREAGRRFVGPFAAAAVALAVPVVVHLSRAGDLWEVAAAGVAGLGYAAVAARRV